MPQAHPLPPPATRRDHRTLPFPARRRRPPPSSAPLPASPFQRTAVGLPPSSAPPSASPFQRPPSAPCFHQPSSGPPPAPSPSPRSTRLLPRTRSPARRLLPATRPLLLALPSAASACRSFNSVTRGRSPPPPVPVQAAPTTPRINCPANPEVCFSQVQKRLQLKQDAQVHLLYAFQFIYFPMVCVALALTSYAHEVFDEMPEPHLSFLLSKLHFPQDLFRFGGLSCPVPVLTVVDRPRRSRRRYHRVP